MASDANLDALQRVANALRVPVSAFSSQKSRCDIEPAAQDSSELLELFAQITDPQIRRECIDFVGAKLAPVSQPIHMSILAD